MEHALEGGPGKTFRRCGSPLLLWDEFEHGRLGLPEALHGQPEMISLYFGRDNSPDHISFFRPDL